MKESIVAATLVVTGLAAMSFCAVGIMGTIESESPYSEAKPASVSQFRSSRPMRAADHSRRPVRQRQVQP